MKERIHALQRLASFALTTGGTAVVGLIAGYAIIGVAGKFEWAALAVIQTAAGLFSVLVAFGWGTTGAAVTASMPAERRPQWYADSLVSRVYLFCIVVPVMAVSMILLNPGHAPLAIVGSVAFLLPSLGASWYFVGEARPARLFLFDALPQLCGLLLSIGTLLVTRSLVAMVATQLFFSLVAVLLSARLVIRSATDPVTFDWSVRAAFARLGAQRHAMITAVTSALYVSAPLVIVQMLLPREFVPVYAIGDRLFRLALTVFAPVLQFVQGWIPEGGRENVPHRIRQAVRLTPVIALLGAIGVFLLGPFAASILSSGDPIDFGLDMSLPFAAVLFLVAMSQVLGLAALVQLGRTRDLTISTLLGALCGLPLLWLGAQFLGIHGVAWALALSEGIVFVYQLVAVLRALRAQRESSKAL